jgi:GNAT superfamily N-acetyltransferase
VVVVARGSDDRALVERAYHEVLAPSFTTDELPPDHEFVAEMDFATLVVALDGDAPVAAAVTGAGSRSPLALLSYLAVRPDQRGSGAGSRMMESLRSVWHASRADVVLGEVHDPRCWPDGADERPAARLRFYERHGARLLTVPWVQPRVRDDGDRVGGMLLLEMWSRHAPEAVPAAWVRSWTTDYFSLAEGLEVPSADPVVAALLARIDAVDPIAIRPIAEYVEMRVLEPSAGG